MSRGHNFWKRPRGFSFQSVPPLFSYPFVGLRYRWMVSLCRHRALALRSRCREVVLNCWQKHKNELRKQSWIRFPQFQPPGEGFEHLGPEIPIFLPRTGSNFQIVERWLVGFPEVWGGSAGLKKVREAEKKRLLQWSSNSSMSQAVTPGLLQKRNIWKISPKRVSPLISRCSIVLWLFIVFPCNFHLKTP